jgi:predicted transcriptional regulator of viral defense system
MRKDGINLTPLETRVLAWSQLNKRRIIRTGDLLSVMNINTSQEAKLLNKMSKSGVVIKLLRGLYLLPDKVPARPWSPSEYYLLAILMQELNAEYQVTGLAAFRFHKLSTQIPNQITVYNTKISGRKKIGIVTFNFIKVSKDRIGDVDFFEINSGDSRLKVYMSSLARTIVDAIYDYSKLGAIPEPYDWIKERRSDENFLKKLVKSTLDFSNISTQRRIGYLLDSLEVDKKLTGKILKALPKTNSLIPMIPQLANRGVNDRKWGVVINGKI